MLWHYNVNEDARPYGRQISFERAALFLEEFPNDAIVTVVAGSPAEQELSRELQDS